MQFQGNLVVGVLAEGGDGSSIIVNIPTMAELKGAVEKIVETPFLNSDILF